jgi:ATP synthase protein I
VKVRETDFKERIEKQVLRRRRAERERAGLVRETVYLGVLGLIFVLPVVAGAYIGHWLDNRQASYSYVWTVGLIVLGVLVGALNVYLFVTDQNDER